MRKQLMKGNEAIVKKRDTCWMPRVLWVSHHACQRDYRGGGALYAAGRRSVFCRRRAKSRR